MKIPRLSKGKMLVGPEFHGCCNSGRRPVILHSHDGNWYVGSEIGVDFAPERWRRVFWRGRPGPYSSGNRKDPAVKKRSVTIDGEKVGVFKTRVSAVAAFEKLCDKVRDYNDRTRAEIASLRDRAKEGDCAVFTLETTISLGLDHGVL